MSGYSPSLNNRNPTAARSFAFAFNGNAGAAVNKAIDQGGYYLRLDQPAWVKIAPTSGLTDVAVPGNTQPAAGSENRTVYIGTGYDESIDVPGPNMSISILGATATGGTVNVSGPLIATTVT